ncbi:MAG TPA: hypothetical protein VF126_17090 [Acidobacteriaceae bacterium]
MNDLLTSIAARSFAPTAGLRPRLPALFEPLSAAAPTAWQVALEGAETMSPRNMGETEPDARLPETPPHAHLPNVDMHPAATPSEMAAKRKTTSVPFTPPQQTHLRRALQSSFTSLEPSPTLASETDGAPARERPAVSVPVRSLSEEQQTQHAMRRPAVTEATALIAAAREPMLPVTASLVTSPHVAKVAAEMGSSVPAVRAARAPAASEFPSVVGTQPDVRVTIGRVEVRALMETTQREPRTASPVVGLDEYLRRGAPRGPS